MTYKELLKLTHPELLEDSEHGSSGCKGCPGDYWSGAPGEGDECTFDGSCRSCWNQKVPENIEDPILSLYPKSMIIGRGGLVYNDTDVAMTKRALNAIWGGLGISKQGALKIKKVIFNPPATIVFWADGTKTVVKAQDEVFDKEKGLAMAISKKAMGNKGSYCNEFKKWLK